MNNRRFIHKKLQNYTPALKVSVKPTIKENKEEVKVLDNNSLKERVGRCSICLSDFVGTDIVKYPFKIINHELGINCRFYDLRGSFATISLRNGCEIKTLLKY